MARSTSYLTLKLDMYKTKPIVVVCTHEKYYEEIRPWIDDESRTGRFAEDHTYVGDHKFAYSFYFDNPNVALEFKMRWL